MLIGLVKWFDPDKGFGVIGTPNEGNFFLHINSFSVKPEKILKGTPIAFLPKIDKEKNRNSAENTRLVGNPEDWKIILSYLGKSDSVSIEVEIIEKRKRVSIYQRRTLYHRKEIQSFSLIGLSLKYFLKDKSETEITNFITDYFDNNLETENLGEIFEVIDCFIIV
jgi:cold shock CspA family protein